MINYIFSDDFKKINIKKNKIEFINYVKEKSLCVNKDNQKLINNVLDNIEKNNSLSEVDVIENLRNLILSDLDKNYNLNILSKFDNKGYRQVDFFKWSLTFLGSLTIKPNQIQIFHMKNNLPKKCQFF